MIEALPVSCFPRRQPAASVPPPGLEGHLLANILRSGGLPSYCLAGSTRGNFPRLARTLPFSRHLGGLFAERSARVPSGWTLFQLSWRIKERG